jgi:hypothetical protein
MTEILWKTNAPHSSLRDQELVELRLVDIGGTDDHRYLVREIHAAWSASAQQIEWKGFADWKYQSHNEAQTSFDSHKSRIASNGFRYTTTLN